jgi:hypothetical protein
LLQSYKERTASVGNNMKKFFAKIQAHFATTNNIESPRAPGIPIFRMRTAIRFVLNMPARNDAAMIAKTGNKSTS